MEKKETGTKDLYTIYMYFNDYQEKNPAHPTKKPRVRPPSTSSWSSHRLMVLEHYVDTEAGVATLETHQKRASRASFRPFSFTLGGSGGMVPSHPLVDVFLGKFVGKLVLSR